MTADQFETASRPNADRTPKRRGKLVAVLIAVVAIVVIAVGGWAGWSFLMPMYQGRDDPYTVLPRSEALLSSGDQDVGRLNRVVSKQTDLHLSESSWTRWTSNDVGANVQLDVKYELHTATPRASGQAAAAAWLDGRIAHAERRLVRDTKVRDIGDEAVEVGVPSGYEVSVRAGNTTITVDYSVNGTEGTKEEEQVQKTARRLAALAVEHIEKANPGAA
ncbi:hypothetical protein SAMN05444921_13334 [Streptomyces wuyuanensis]|uniref:Uncharacterized protein n=1 Tax=Streptomyces wuyuanensis TaxID=1196353 RepID=A0A1H0DDD9_9ACTN|nr:hypothetical protein SAMN05444921_13334 [Streptomyces wuyuanensis]